MGKVSSVGVNTLKVNEFGFVVFETNKVTRG